MNEQTLIIIPTYNERKNLERLTEEIYAQGPFHLLIVDTVGECLIRWDSGCAPGTRSG